MSHHPTHDAAHQALIDGLTPARRRALDILAQANRPIGAYEMLDLMVGADGRRPAPVSVYRALAYLLICEDCGDVEEATSAGLARELAALAGKAGFRARTRVVEIAGRCARCAAG